MACFTVRLTLGTHLMGENWTVDVCLYKQFGALVLRIKHVFGHTFHKNSQGHTTKMDVMSLYGHM